MRHGPAIEPDEWAGDDDSRPLSAQGIEKTRSAARGLASLNAATGIVASSPKIRALETARIVQDSWNGNFQPQLEEWPELASDDFPAWLERLRATKTKSVLIVGHEPDLSRFASLLLAFDADVLNINWKKAGVLTVELDIDSGRATLLWMISPRVLRALGEPE
jgi:phosphohistidine phosphatase